jgi:hypothetical protein
MYAGVHLFENNVIKYHGLVYFTISYETFINNVFGRACSKAKYNFIFACEILMFYIVVTLINLLLLIRSIIILALV